MMFLWAFLAFAAPPDATLVYYNARMALREGRPVEAVDLWLLRNAVRDQKGRISPYDDDFRSITWAALGEIGACQDGLAKDEDGVGLWPLALHNQVVRNLGRSKPGKRPRPFSSFEVGRQQRFVSITDVLSLQELKTFELRRGRCIRPWLALQSAGETSAAGLRDRQVAARLLRYLLEQAKGTLAKERVRGLAAIDARLFDIDLQLTALAAREARKNARDLSRQGKDAGMSRTSVTALTAEAPATTLDPNSVAAGILRASASWPASEWMALAPDRRIFLYTQARTYEQRQTEFTRIGLAIIDAEIAEGDGAAVDQWIGQVGTDARAIWSGERGRALLALDRSGDPGAGFRERAVIALHRGIDSMERGDLMEALRSIAYAREHAHESRAAEELDGLSLRWLSYVASQFTVSAELLVTLQELVPRRDYAVILEDLMWTAAFHADRESFEAGVNNQAGRGALERRLVLLAPLAAGDVDRFAAGVRAGLAESPSETLRFLDQLVQRLETEDAGIRAAQVRTLVALRRQLAPLAADTDANRQGRAAVTLMERMQAIADGVGGLPETSARDRAHALTPNAEVYAGSIRLAPADPVPWPFRAVDPPAPSIFTPLLLRPVEWRDGEDLVFGWSIRG